jgi:hypothetical protein
MLLCDASYVRHLGCLDLRVEFDLPSADARCIATMKTVPIPIRGAHAEKSMRRK